MRIISLMICLFCGIAVYAIPAKKIRKEIIQSDGRILTINLVGDEFLSYYTTDDGIPLVENEYGDFYYASIVNGDLGATNRMATSLLYRSFEEQLYVSQLNVCNDSLEALYRVRRDARSHTSVTSTRSARSSTTNYVGEKRGLVILVQFTDLKLQSTAKGHFESQINEVGYSGNNHYGSVYDYFIDQSNGKFALNFDVVGPVTLTRNASYYGRNGADGHDQRPGAMVGEACLAVDHLVDFSQYDWDGDGEMEQVYVIYAGYSEAHGAPASTIWPHMWSLESSDYGRSLRLDNTKVNVYACSSELKGTAGAVFDGIGTLCHEYSHCLGLPDFYDTSNTANAFGLDRWSVMDYGCYLEEGNVPCAYTAYEKWFCGWQEPILLTSGTTVTAMAPFSQQGNSYIVYNEAYKNEYYLLENRQKIGWDIGLPGHGLLVFHVDYDATIWANNSVNTVSTHQRMTIIPADDILDSGSLAGDPFPGSTRVTEFTDSSTPNAKLYHINSNGSKLMGKPITQITENSQKEISFHFMGGDPTSIGHLRVDSGSDVSHRIEEMLTDHRTQIYSLDGVCIPMPQLSTLPNGVYILRNNSESYKISINN